MDYSLQFARMWNESSDRFPSDIPRVEPEEKKLREVRFNAFQLGMKKELDERREEGMAPAVQFRLIRLLVDFFKDIAGYPDQLLEVMFSEGMMKSTTGFVHAARQSDPGISFSDLFQAMRNVWIMNGLQFLMNRPVRLTASVFAYSMLYPYTDNYLDDPAVTSRQKQEFCLRFGRRLAGEAVLPMNRHEEKIFRMVSLIEGEWSRMDFPKVYQSLLGIHEAQTRSIALLSGSLSEQDIFSICAHKGGMSVIADGYLVLGEMSREEEEFFYCYGAYLQLLDDLQDSGSDFDDSLMTVFSRAAGKEKLDLLLNRTYFLGLKVLAFADRIRSPRLPEFKALMKRSIDLFLIGAVVTNDRFFSRDFIREFEAFSPLGFSFVRKKDKTLSPYQNRLMEEVLKRMVLNDQAGDLLADKKTGIVSVNS